MAIGTAVSVILRSCRTLNVYIIYLCCNEDDYTRFSGVQYFWQRVFYWQRPLQVQENCFKITFTFPVEFSAGWVIQYKFQKSLNMMSRTY